MAHGGEERRFAPLLEVAVLHPRDVRGADEGGADRLFCADRAKVESGLSPEPGLVSSVCKETELPVRVLLRLNDSHTTTGGELTRLVGLAESYLAVGAAGVVFGFLDGDLWSTRGSASISPTSSPGCRGRSPRRSMRPWRRTGCGVRCCGCQVSTRCTPPGRLAGWPPASTTWSTARAATRRWPRCCWRAAGSVPSTCPGCCARACGSSTSARPHGRAARGTRRTSTRGTCGRGGCCSTTPPAGPPAVPHRAPHDAAHRPARRAAVRPDVVPPGQRRVVRGAAPVRPRAGHPANAASTATTTTSRASATGPWSPPVPYLCRAGT